MGQVALSFVIPAYNEEESIEAVLITLDDIVKPEELEYEIVVVNDGSKDQTLSKALKYANENSHVTVVSYGKNEGKGHAVKTGFATATGDIVVFADSDMEIDLNTISKYVAALQDGDIVIGSKWHPDSRVQVPITRKILSRSFNALVRILTGAKMNDTQVGLKVLRKSSFEKIFPKLAVKRYAFDVELLALAALYGLKVVEMPVQLDLNARFKIREIWKMLIDLLGIAYRLRVLHAYENPAKTTRQQA